MLWLGIHLPDLALEAFTLREVAPTGEEVPRVVVEDNRVMLGNAAATAAGIVPGSTLATAHSLLPGLCHYRRSPGQEMRRLHRLAELLYRFSAQVSLVPPDGVVAEIGASLRLFGGVESLTCDAAALCRDLGHRISCRTAGTPLAALTLARAGTAEVADAPLCRAAIEPAHLSAATLEQLANMGVHTVGQLLKLPADGLAARFGKGLVDYLQRLTGARPDPRRWLQPSARFRRHLHLLSPLRNKEPLLVGPMTQLLTELQHWLVAHQLGVEQLRWQFAGASRGEPPVLLTVRFSRGQQSQARLFDISRLELERAALPGEVISLGLRAERLQPWQTGSQALFRYLPPADPASHQPAGSLSTGHVAELGELVDKLEARLGRGACWSLRALDQHLPEAAWQPVPPLPGKGDRLPGGRRVAGGRRPPLTAGRARGKATRPVWLFQPPRAIQPERLTLLRGPERIETGWWRMTDDDWRDYYVARHECGAECWVFIDARAHWYLHGYFG